LHLTGLVTGLGGFVGFQGWDVMGRSWKELGALAIVAVSPQMMVSGQGFPGYQPGEIQATVTGMGKSLIAYDRWASDPAQAAGESVFNIATFFIPVGGAAAGAAKAASLAGKTAQVVGVAGKAAKVTDVVKASRVADVVAGVRTTLDLHLNNATNALHTALGGPDRALADPGPRHLPEAPVPHTPDLHTPDLHAMTVHPDAPATPHPAGPTSHGGGQRAAPESNLGTATSDGGPLSLHLNDFPASQDISAYARNIPHIPGEYDVGMHGTPDLVELLDSNGAPVRADAATLAEHIRSQPDYLGEPIRLLSCSTGSSAGRLAQELSNELGVKVTAPSDTLWIFQDGRMTIGPGFADNIGRWEDFLPESNDATGVTQ